MKTFINDERGVSSVLIVIMMIVLIIFGLAGLTLAMSNTRLADKKISWLSEYYLLESEANQRIAAIDAAIVSADGEDEIMQQVNELNRRKNLDIIATKDEMGALKISFTAQKNAEYPKYIDVVLSVIKGANGKYSLITEKFIQYQAPFEYESIF